MIRTRSIALLSGAALLALTACDTTTMGEREQNGAIGGAVLGGIIGAAAGQNKGVGALGGAAIGATAGAIAGGAIGAALDRQAAELDQSLDNGISVVNAGDYLIVTMPEDLLFPTDSATVSPNLMDDLAAVAASLKKYPDTRVEVIGHTDNTGDASYNQQLSERRASSVASVLFSNGIPTWRVATIGRGESQPVATNLTPEGRAQNRRVEIIIRPNT